jgi:hypothetical protein
LPSAFAALFRAGHLHGAPIFFLLYRRLFGFGLGLVLADLRAKERASAEAPELKEDGDDGHRQTDEQKIVHGNSLNEAPFRAIVLVISYTFAASPSRARLWCSCLYHPKIPRKNSRKPTRTPIVHKALKVRSLVRSTLLARRR